jgi:hypothetical protein
MVKMPHRLDTAAADFGGENRSKPVPPEPNRFVRDVDTALVQEVLDVPERQRIPDVHHHCKADNLGRRFEVAEDASVRHKADDIGTPPCRKPIFLSQCPTALGNPAVIVGQPANAALADKREKPLFWN